MKEITIQLDESKSVTLHHVCHVCGTTADSTPIEFMDRGIYEGTGRPSGVYSCSRSTWPEGWETFRGRDICPTCADKIVKRP